VVSSAYNVAPECDLSWYLEKIRKFAMFTPEEEWSLAHRWRDTQDKEAAHKVVTSYLRLVAKTGMCYRGYGLPVGGPEPHPGQ
jgi:RNA polymerase sigma-32 factor